MDVVNTIYCSQIETRRAPYFPKHKTFIESAIAILFSPFCTLLEETDLSAKYWEDAFMHVKYVNNGFQNKAHNIFPFERVKGKNLKLHHMDIFLPRNGI